MPLPLMLMPRCISNGELGWTGEYSSAGESARLPPLAGDPALSPNMLREVLRACDGGSKPCATALSTAAARADSFAAISLSSSHFALYSWYSSLLSSYMAAWTMGKATSIGMDETRARVADTAAAEEVPEPDPAPADAAEEEDEEAAEATEAPELLANEEELKAVFGLWTAKPLAELPLSE